MGFFFFLISPFSWCLAGLEACVRKHWLVLVLKISLDCKPEVWDFGTLLFFVHHNVPWPRGRPSRPQSLCCGAIIGGVWNGPHHMHSMLNMKAIPLRARACVPTVCHAQ